MKDRITQHSPALSKGDVIFRYPYNGDPEEVFDSTRTRYIQTYQVRSMNEKSGILELVMSDATQPLFATPGEVSRLFINAYLLAEQKIWWLEDQRQNE